MHRTLTRHARTVLDTPPRLLLRRIWRKAAGRSAKFDIGLLSPGKLRPQRPYDFLSRYEAILARNMGWSPLQFDGRIVLEIGCGPLLGWGPLAIFRGAERFVCVDPEADVGLVDLEPVIRGYLRPMHNDLCALFGERMSFEVFIRSIRERLGVLSEPLETATLPGAIDVVLSNSCLEHIGDLESAMRNLVGACAPEARSLHLVDFGNHRATENPLDDIYAGTPEEYVKKFGRGINLLRPPDIVRVLRSSGFEVDLVPYYSAEEGHDGRIDNYWLERYERSALFLKAGLVAGHAGFSKL
jgi:SAM-dependent methyltransferase